MKRSIIILTVVVLLATLIVAYGVLAKEVTIIDGEDAIQAVSFRNNVKELLEEEGIELREEDRLLPGSEAPLKDNMEVVIKRAVPVYVVAAGQEREVLTAADTVGQVLDHLGMEVEEDDIVDPGTPSCVNRDMKITVVRVTHDSVTEEREIPFKTVTRDNDEMYKGIERVLDKGYNGRIRESILLTYHDGQEVAREIVNKEMIKEPKDRVVEKGTKDSLVTSRGTVRFKRAVYMTATAYDATFESTGKNPGHPQYGVTRSGTKVRPGVVAVDPKVIPLGTKLYVKSLDKTPDYGFASAEDTGGAIKGNKIDLYFESPQDVKKYGRRQVIVYILE